jgi:hypothetical protein
MQNGAIGLYILIALILYLGQKDGGSLQVSSFAALGFLLVLAFVSPLIAFVLAVPIFLIVWFKNYQTVLDGWAKLKKSTVKIGGN